MLARGAEFRTALLRVGLAGVLISCQRTPPTPTTAPSSSTAPASDRPPWKDESIVPAAPQGMLYVPPGPLFVGTPPERLPRVPDEEMPGSQVAMGGFFIDRFLYPNEEGAIPTTGVTNDAAAQLCEDRKKRLCTELEWERACKGPANTTYEYGDRYRAELCATGSEPRLAPSGYRIG